MNELLAMTVPTTSDSSGYFLRFPSLLPVFVLPAICFYALLAIWVIKKIRSVSGIRTKGADAGPTSSPSNDSGQSAQMDHPCEEQIGEIVRPLELRFYRPLG